MGRTACTEPQCLYKGALYLYILSVVDEWVRDNGGMILTVGNRTRRVSCLWVVSGLLASTMSKFADVLLSLIREACTKVDTHSVWCSRAVECTVHGACLFVPLLYSFLEALAKLREKKTTLSFVISVCPHGRTRLPMNEFLWKWYLCIFRKYVDKFRVLLKFDKKIVPVYFSKICR